MTTQALVPVQNQNQALSMANSSQFEHIQRVAKLLSESSLVPQAFQKNIPNCVIGLEIAQRIGASPFAVLQQIYVVHGKPSWSSVFIISSINSCGRYEPLMFEMSGTGDQRQCVAWTTPRGEQLQRRDDKKQWTIALAKSEGYTVFDGPAVSIDMAKKEGWYSKNQSKWQTMPELMLRYRAATFFGRLYAPELLLGMKSEFESHETIDVQVESTPLRFGSDKEQNQTAPPPSEPATEVAAETGHVVEAEVEPEPPQKPVEAATPAVGKEETVNQSVAKKYAPFTCEQVVATVIEKMAHPAFKDCKAKSFDELSVSQAQQLLSGYAGIIRMVKKQYPTA